MNSEFWLNKIRAFLHDPPDKTIELRTHVPRRMEILGDLKFYADEPLLGIENIKKEIRKNWRKYPEKRRFYEDFGDLPSIPQIHKSDIAASSLQRIDLEKSFSGKSLVSTFYRVHHTKKYEYLGPPVLRHPVTGEIREFRSIVSMLPKADGEVIDVNDPEREEYESRFNDLLNKILEIERKVFSSIRELCGNDYRKLYFSLWASYEDELRKALEKEFSASFAEEFVNLPAYTLSPDHTLFDHADATSAIFGAEQKNPTLVLFKLSPVQKFIADARKEKDLWAASHLLAVLTLHAISVVVEQYGPDAIIYPHLRGNPLFQAWMHSKGIGDKPSNLSIASIPNKFLALVGADRVDEMRDIIRKRIEDVLNELFDEVWKLVEKAELRELAKAAAEDLEEKIRECTDPVRKKYLEGELGEVESYAKGNKKEFHRQILLSHFNATLSSIKIPKEMDLEDNREEAYRKLKDFVRSLKLPKKIEAKYIDWLKMLESVEASDNKPSLYDLYFLYYEILTETNAIESSNFEKPLEPAGYKCTLCGEHIAIGGESERLMKNLWRKMHTQNPGYIRWNEHLCAVCAVKRLYPRYVKELELFKNINEEIVPKTESVSEVAMERRTKAEITWKDIYDYLRGNRGLDNIESEELKEELEELKSLVSELIEHVVSGLRKQGVPYSDDFLKNLRRNFSNEMLYIENLSDYKSLLDTLGIKIEVEDIFDETLLYKTREKLSEIYELLGEPPRYYAILMMDGDEMGRLLGGEKMKTTEHYLHPKLLDRIGDDLRSRAKSVRRLITPAAHAAISRSLKNFAINHVPKIVRRRRGSLIYAGGDDVLALFPTNTAFDAAAEIASVFSTSWNGWEILPGATMSAGLLVVHYKHPLYDALDKARSLLDKAKKLGRKAIAAGFLKRSGSYYETVVNYDSLHKAKAIAETMIAGRVSPRVLYELMDVTGTLPQDAMRQIVKYEAMRHSENEGDARRFLSLFNGGVSGARVEIEDGEERRKINEIIRDCGSYNFNSIAGEQAKGFLNLVKIIYDAMRGEER